LSLSGLLERKEVLVDVIDVATNDIESAELVADTIKATSGHVDAERIVPCTNCGLAPLPRSVAEGKLKALGAGTALAKSKI